MNAGNNYYFLSEIEFYFNSNAHHDEYTHKHKRQHMFGVWYFHKYKTERFLNSKRFGLDIAFGNETNYGGILLRIVHSEKDNAPVQGINRIVKKFVNDFNKINLSKIALENLPVDKNSYLKIEDATSVFSEFPIKKSQRIGLKFSEKEGKREFYNKLYRYYNHDFN